MADKIAIVSFTEKGTALGTRIQKALGGKLCDARREEGFSLADWTRQAFASCDALIFIGAAGIAVRAIAPHVHSKAADPAVLCVDESGRFVIPLLSGHLGGANALARRLAVLTEGTAVITTATDLNGVFAVDLWAKKQGMTVLQPERIKRVSSKILAGETVRIQSPWPIACEAPQLVQLGEPCDAAVDFRPRDDEALQLVPRLLILGIGCRRCITAEQMEAQFVCFCRERHVLPQAIAGAASIDRKQDEAGLLAFCERRGLPLRFFSAEALRAAEGSFSASDFVENTVGVDNVCERSAVLAADGALIEKKYAAGGVTFALAAGTPDWDWSW